MFVRPYDLRRTFITLAQVDGARKDILEAISHGPRGDIVSVYTTFPWPVLCAEVRKLKIEPAGVRIPRGLVPGLVIPPLQVSRAREIVGQRE